MQSLSSDRNQAQAWTLCIRGVCICLLGDGEWLGPTRESWEQTGEASVAGAGALSACSSNWPSTLCNPSITGRNQAQAWTLCISGVCTCLLDDGEWLGLTRESWEQTGVASVAGAGALSACFSNWPSTLCNPSITGRNQAQAWTLCIRGVCTCLLGDGEWLGLTRESWEQTGEASVAGVGALSAFPNNWQPPYAITLNGRNQAQAWTLCIRGVCTCLLGGGVWLGTDQREMGADRCGQCCWSGRPECLLLATGHHPMQSLYLRKETT
jgi:hypothetical protein